MITTLPKFAKIEIKCTGAGLIKLDDFIELQGNLKDLSDKSFEKFARELIEDGFSEPISVWLETGTKRPFILNGHQRVRTLKKLREMKWDIPNEYPISFIEAENEKQARRKCLALAAQYGEVTDDGLYEYLNSSGFDLNIIEDFRYPEIDTDKFLKEFTNDAGKDAIEDEVPEVKDNGIVKQDDIWILGNHRIMCGDSTNRGNLLKLFRNDKAKLWSSDPPYGISYVSNQKSKGFDLGYTDIKNDDLTDSQLQEFLFNVINISLEFMDKNFAFYMWHAMKMQGYTAAAAAAAAAAGILFHRQIIWVKPQFVFGRGHYHWRHELCLMGWLKGDEPPFYGNKNQSTVWEIAKENDKIHPTQKPLDVFSIPIQNHLKMGEIVYEPFMGSGSNIIASEKNNVVCYGLELEPKYVEATIERWQKYAGKEAYREADGIKYNDLKYPKL